MLLLRLLSHFGLGDLHGVALACDGILVMFSLRTIFPALKRGVLAILIVALGSPKLLESALKRRLVSSDIFNLQIDLSWLIAIALSSHELLVSLLF
jgi:hypothetical protein